MKTALFVLLIALVVPRSEAQPRDGRKLELSLSGAYQTYSTSNSLQSVSVFFINTRLGFFVFGGLELEPEALCLLSSGSDPTYALNGNVVYNIVASAKAVPFFLVGYGTANTVPFLNVPFTRISFPVGVLNLGAGLKIFIKDDVAIRVEYRYQRFSGEARESNYGYVYSNSVDSRIHSIQFGFSVLP